MRGNISLATRNILYFLSMLYLITYVKAMCPSVALSTLSLVVEYAIWRGWHQALIYTPGIEQGCDWATVKLVKCLGVNGIACAIGSKHHAPFNIRLGIIVLSPSLSSKQNATAGLANVVNTLQRLQMNTASYDWLITTRSYTDFKYVNDIFNASSMRFDQNVVVTYPSFHYRLDRRSLGLCDLNFKYKTQRGSFLNFKQLINCKYGMHNCDKNEYERNYYRSTERFKNLKRNYTYVKNGTQIPLLRSGILNYDYSRIFHMINISRITVVRLLDNWNGHHSEHGAQTGILLMQYFKVRNNSTLYASFLGVWMPECSMSRVEAPYPVEARNFLTEELIIGRCNTSNDGSLVPDDERPSSPALLNDVLHFLTTRMNATSSTRYYNKLGYRTYEGVWTGLLGALMDHSVDIALEPVTAHTSRQDIDFIFPIARTMCNIYIRHQETSAVRDIFLAPFSPRLLVCVLAVIVAGSVLVVCISKLTSTFAQEVHLMNYTEAFIWTVGILCQQGSTWTPPNPAASILLIVCLLFAVVTYNAYAAFITSVLSVRVASVDTVADVLHSPNFKIGYIRNGADQMYLMSTKDAQLNAFYIRGYSEAENLVTSAEEGLSRAAKQDYAFFAGQRAARSTLRSFSQERGRCALLELPVHSTRTELAFPIPHQSAYARPILISLLQMRGGGVLARLEDALVPTMPQCEPPSGFASARAADVRTALVLLATGLLVAIIIGFGEYCWKNKKQQRKYMYRCYRRLHNLIT